MQPCPAECGYAGLYMGQHFRNSPHCVPVQEAGPPEAKKSRDPSKASKLFSSRVAGTVGKAMLLMHVDQYMTMPSLELVRNMLVVGTELAVEYIESELSAGADADPSLFQRARSAFTDLPTAQTMVAQRSAAQRSESARWTRAS